MANEITAAATLACSKNGVSISAAFRHQFTLTGNQMAQGIQVIGTSTEQIVFPADLIAEGISYVALKNLDATNFVQVGLNTPVTQIFAKILPGGVCIFPVYNQAAAGAPLYYAKADTGACSLAFAAAGIT